MEDSVLTDRRPRGGAAPRQRRIVLVVSGLAVVVLAGVALSGAFGAHGPSASGAQSPTGTPVPVLVEAPLTGLLVSPVAAARHVIAVMIDDLAPARPQSGFNAASVVWQAPAEGGIPRYMLLFQSTVPAAVGPVRSAREYFLEWASEWDAVYAHAGGSPQALASLAAHGNGSWVFNADQFRWGPYFRRVAFNFAPHNLYTDGHLLEALARRLLATALPMPPVWQFAPDADPSVRPVGGRITIYYPTEEIQYRYDSASNTYVRYVAGSARPQVDAADHRVVAPKNVVILRMAFGPLNDSEPQKGRLEAQDVGQGDAWIATNGHTIHGTWRKASPTAPTLLFGPDGQPVTLTAGQTFIQVIDLNYRYTIVDGRAAPAPS
jgi:Protein of unknown function (DUF3048) N-terminal domain/Protein of unknown function (DUF3048) C-terminal domain